MKRIKKVLLSSLALSIVFVSTAFAYNFTPKSYAGNSDHFSHAVSPRPWFIGISAGVTWPSLSKGSTTVPNGNPVPPPYNVDLYTVNTPNTAATWSFYVGYRWVRSCEFFPIMSVALRYAHIFNFNISGTIDQYSVPGQINYNYTMNVSPNIATVFGKFDIYEFHSFAPYVSLGLGESFNSITNYTEQAMSGTIPRVSPGYGDRMVGDFTYNLGAGLDYFLNPRTTFSLGYEYANLGKIMSGDGVSTWSGTALSFGTLTSNTILLSAFYQLPA